ncbi:hypothetical protein [Vulcanisaeta sp. JCM 16161]|uniref:hypothetical protein n=1 Tax=Vulcanisaeta sp. JCM 16161 TaxID=1295372 RepID=UPI001FB34080|nr:hypothetical protein [Vulcanisaeta sp. JCM 16161]
MLSMKSVMRNNVKLLTMGFIKATIMYVVTAAPLVENSRTTFLLILSAKGAMNKHR